MSIYEMYCRHCKQTFIGDDENDTIHIVDQDGKVCMRRGLLMRVYRQENRR